MKKTFNFVSVIVKTLISILLFIGLVSCIENTNPPRANAGAPPIDSTETPDSYTITGNVVGLLGGDYITLTTYTPYWGGASFILMNDLTMPAI